MNSNDYPTLAANPYIVVAVYNHWKSTAAFLDSLVEQRVAIPVILVDDGSTDRTANVEEFPGLALTVVRHQENKGVAPSWNTGVRLALARNADAIIIVNNDIVVRNRSAVHTLLENLTHRIGITGYAGGILCKGSLEFDHITEDTDMAHYVSGHCFAIRSAVFSDIGLFDEVFAPAFCEDSDFCIRARMHGWKFKLVRTDDIEHHQHTTVADFDLYEDVQVRNTAILRDRYRGKLNREKLLVVRTGALGDIVMTTPVLRALRMENPYASIHLRCGTQFSPVLRYNRDIDIVDSHLKAGDYDRVINLDRSYERRGIGSTHPPTAYAEDAEVTLPHIRYHVPPGPVETSWARAVLNANPHSGKTVIVGLRSGNRPSSNWSAGKWKLLFQAMSGVRFVPIDLIPRTMEFGPQHGGAAIYDLPNVLDLTGKTPDLLYVTALLEQADACITVDTSTLHLANAAGCPTVALMGGKSWESRRWVSDDVPCIPIEGSADCFPCDELYSCPMTRHCLEAVSVQRVEEALKEILCLKST